MGFIKNNLVQFSLLIATFSTIGSLIFSETLGFPPCTLCWYQRVAMYPLVVILAIGIWKKDKYLPYLALPFSIIGLIIAAYHNLLYYGIIPESAASCTLGISCTTKYVEWFGFVTIPLLSLLSFLAITILMFLFKKYTKN